MKKIIVLLSLIFICPYAFAGQYSTTLDKIENSLFGFTYSNEAEIDYVIDKLPGIIEKVTSISPYQKELQALKALKYA